MIATHLVAVVILVLLAAGTTAFINA